MNLVDRKTCERPATTRRQLPRLTALGVVFAAARGTDAEKLIRMHKDL